MTVGWQQGFLRDHGGDSPPRSLVVKLGGSLLVRPGWARQVATLLEPLSAPRLIIVGGGPLVDGLRALDRAEPQPAQLMHQLAIECMGHTARLVAAALGLPIVTEPGSTDAPTAVLDVPGWLAQCGRLARLPVGWHVTSDSIAAAVAAALDGALVLVKSVSPADADLDELAAAGWVDAFFPQAARPLDRITWAAPMTDAAAQ